MPEQTIEKGETKKIIDSDEAGKVYRDEDIHGFELEVKGGPVRMEHSKQNARQGREYPAGREGMLSPKGRPMFAYAPDRDVTLEVTEAGFEFNLYAPISINGIENLANHPGIVSEEYVTGTVNTERFPSNQVPEGISVAVQSKPGNTDPIYVGGSAGQNFRLNGSDSISLRVDNTDVIRVNAGTAGDGVNYIFEDK